MGGRTVGMKIWWILDQVLDQIMDSGFLGFGDFPPLGSRSRVQVPGLVLFWAPLLRFKCNHWKLRIYKIYLTNIRCLSSFWLCPRDSFHIVTSSSRYPCQHVILYTHLLSLTIEHTCLILKLFASGCEESLILYLFLTTPPLQHIPCDSSASIEDKQLTQSVESCQAQGARIEL